MDIIEKLIANAFRTNYEDLPKDAIDITKRSILDVISCLIAGASAPGCQVLVDQIKDWGGKKEGSIMVYGGKVPAPNASLVNSVMARALDFDDAMAPGIHISASAVPTAFAVAEMVGGVEGKKLLTAITVGVDVAARINFAVSDYRGFDPTGVCTIFGTTVVAAKLLGLDEKTMLDALGIAFNMAAGSFQSNIDGALAVRLIQGLTGKSGILSAVLSQKGYTGVKKILTGLYGYFHLYSNDRYDLNVLTDQLGKRYEGIKTLFKKYPSCGGTLAATEAAIKLAHDNEIVPEEIEQITVKVTQLIYNLTGHPFRIGQHPEVDAQFSLQYTVANALVKKRSILEDFTEKSIKDSRVISLAKKVHPMVYDNINQTAMDMAVKMKDGRMYTHHVDFPKGFPQNPLTEDEQRQKYFNCLAFANNPLAEEKSEKIITMVNQLEDVSNVEEIVALLVTI